MSFANHNILDIALSVIPPTVVQIRKAVGVSVNDYGQANSAYGEWREVYGIVQPGSESNEHTEGIDFSKKRVRIWLRGVDLTGTHIQDAPDQIRYLGRIYNVVSVDDWFPYDNYRMCECVEALNIPPSQRARKATATTAKRKPRTSDKAVSQTFGDMSNVKAAAKATSTSAIQEELPLSTIPPAETKEKAEEPVHQQQETPTPEAKPIVKKAMIRF